jgi:hypothetical protein
MENSALRIEGYFASAFATHSGANESRYRQNRNIQQIVANSIPWKNVAFSNSCKHACVSVATTH